MARQLPAPSSCPWFHYPSSLRYLAALIFCAAALAAQSHIVSTSPGLTEILFALGLGNQVVGVSEYCVFPEAAKSKPKVGNFLQPNLEAIAALKPNVVYIIKNPVRLKQRLESLKLRVEELDLETIPGILAAIESIGAQNNKAREARALKSNLEQRLARLKSSVKQRFKVAFLVGRTPQRLEGMIAVGRGGYLDNLLNAAGGDNIFADAGNMYPKISIEQLLARQPDAIFEMGDSVHEGKSATNYQGEVLRVWATLPALKAVKSKRVFPLNDSLFVVPGPRFVEAAERFYQMLHESKP
jgi:iron complex transport system substrate-binding protein